MENSDIKKLKFYFTTILGSQGIKGKRVEIEEKNLNFAVTVLISKNQSLKDIRTILLAFEKIEQATSDNYSAEIEMYQPDLTLYLDKFDD